MTNDEAGKILQSLRHYYPHAQIFRSEERLAAYADILCDYEYAAVAANGKRYVAHNKYFPDLSDLLDGLCAAGQDGPVGYDRNAWMDEFLLKQRPVEEIFAEEIAQEQNRKK